MSKESWCGGGIKSWRGNHGGGIMEKKSRRGLKWNREGSIWSASGCIWGAIWRISGCIWEDLRRHLVPGGTMWETSGDHVAGTMCQACIVLRSKMA